MRDHATFRIGLAMAAGAMLAGCAGSTPSSSAPAPATSPSPSASPLAPSSAPPSSAPPSSSPPSRPAPSSSAAAPLPTLTKPAKPPREPSDNLPATGWVAGTVTRGGTGPCYGLIADDGTQYALHSTEGISLDKGARVKVNLETTMLRIYCGPGKLMAMLEAAPIR